MTGGTAFTWLAAIWAALAVPALAGCLARWDPIARSGGRGVGPRIDSRWGWFLMEIPALATFPAIYLASSHQHPVGNLVVAMWIAHYGHRAFLWPWLVQRRDRTMPLIFCGSGILFNLFNGVLWGWFLGYLAHYPSGWLGRPLVVTGLVLAVGGAALNVWSDYRLSHLRRASGGAYVMPSGGPFDLVSCPNLLGEIIEWIGFALLTWSLPGLAFAMWTIANLLPRALWRHGWYRKTFADYPRRRRALLPALL